MVEKTRNETAGCEIIEVIQVGSGQYITSRSGNNFASVMVFRWASNWITGSQKIFEAREILSLSFVAFWQEFCF